MKTRRTFLAACSALALAGLAFAASQFTTIPHENNIVANRLEGYWKIDTELTRKLDPDRSTFLMSTLEFKMDRTAMDKLKKYAQRRENSKVYSAGFMKVNDKEAYPYLLSNNAGNMILTWFMPLEDDPVGMEKSMPVCVGCSRNKRQDVLFLGGDRARASSAAYSRATPPEQE